MSKGLLLGAGFSYNFGMPLVGELTKIFLGIFNKEKANYFAEKISKKEPYSKERPINKEAIFKGMNFLLEYKDSAGRNYEEFLSKLLQLEKNSNTRQSDIDSYSFLSSTFYEIIYQILTQFQMVSYVTLYHKNLQWFANFKNILSEKETWVFTLSHDLYLECLAMDLKIPITFGDTGVIPFPISNLNMKTRIDLTCKNRNDLFLGSANFFKGLFGINLVKLHGSLSELEYKDKEIICNQSLIKSSSWQILQDFEKINKMAYYHNGKIVPSGGVDRWVTNSNGELDIICRAMLTGGNKYSITLNEKKGEEKLKLLTDVLEKLEELIIIGYGFGDKHINNRISQAMILNQKLKVQIVDPAHTAIPECLLPFNYDNRISRAYCGSAHWFDYSISHKCNYEQVNALKENESLRGEIIKKIESSFFK